MTKWRITLANLGREHINRSEIVVADDLARAETLATSIACQHLYSQDVWIDNYRENFYTVYAGIRKVGKLKIQQIKPKGRVNYADTPNLN